MVLKNVTKRIKIVIINKIFTLCLFLGKRNIWFFRPLNQNYFGCFKRDFFDKILRHPRKRFLGFFIHFGVKIYVKMIYSSN
ncbi:MAG: hypothetical protein C0412_01045 [Flavobacterium sp.]|nr:hypothetical protein [Flavobacterium sp.]